MPGPPLVSVQAFLRVSAWASHGGVGPWASAPGRWVAGQEAGPFAGRRQCGQLCCVGASGLALCSIRAWSQTALLLSCWDCGEAGRLDWGCMAGGRDTRCQGPAGPASMPLHIRPRIKVALGAEPASVGLAGSNMAAGPWGLAWAAGAAGAHLHPHIAGGVARDPFEQGSSSLAALLCRAWWRSPLLSVPVVPGPSSSLFLLSLFAPPPAALSLSACARGLYCFPSPQGSLPADTLSPWSYLLLPASVCLLFPTSPPEPFSLWALSGSPIPLPSLAWSPCPCVPRSPCVGGDRGVSREESVCFSAPAAGWLPW